MAKDNSCATENKKVGPFEVFKLLSNQANMFNRGVSSNLSELFAKLEEDDSLYKDNPKYYTYLREMGRLKDPENVNATPIL